MSWKFRSYAIAMGVLVSILVATFATAMASKYLPTEEPPSALCDTLVSSSPVGYANVEALAWASHQVVAGRVVGSSPPQWSEPFVTGFHEDEKDVPVRTITTDYIVQVESRIRGEDLDYIRVRLEGGAIGNCEIVNETTPPLTSDEHILLFLHTGFESALPATFAITGGTQGLWTFVDDDHVVPSVLYRTGHEHDVPAEAVHSLHLLAEQLRTSLANGDIPEGDARPYRVVPLEEAPLAPIYP